MITPIIILLLLTAPYGIIRLLKKDKYAIKKARIFGITLVFIYTGIGHFVKTDAMVTMIPEFFPQPVAIVYLTGVIEIVLAVLVLLTRFQRLVGWIFIAMLVSFLPVNVYAAINHISMGGHAWGPVYLLIRIPLQLILMIWIYFSVLPKKNREQ